MERYNSPAAQQRLSARYGTQAGSSGAGKFSYWNDSDSKIYEIDATPVYKQIKRPLLTMEKVKKLEDQLAIEKQASEKYQTRIQEKALILPFRINPFTHDIEEMEKNKAKKKKSRLYDKINSNNSQTDRIHTGQISNRSQKKRNLIAEIEKFRQSKGVVGRQMKNGLKNLILDKQKISSNLSKCVFDKSISPNNKIHHRSVTQKDQKKSISTKKRHFSQQMSMEDILKINEDSFYEKRMKMSNIFTLIFRKRYKIHMGHPFIDRYYFCHQSNRQIVQKLKISIFRDISQFARSLMKSIKPKQNKLDYLQPKQMNVDTENIDFESILSVASGRLTSRDIIAMMGEDKTKRGNASMEENATSSVYSQEQIDYAPNSNNIACHKFDKDQEIAENMLFQHIQMNIEEKNQKKDFQRQLLELTATFREEEVKYFLKIEDKKLGQAIEEKKNAQTSGLIQKLNEFIDDKERLIRRSKQKKDRSEQIKIQALISAAKLSKQFMAKLKKEKKGSLSPRRHLKSMWK